MLDIPSGAIVALKGGGVAGWMSENLCQPTTDRFHFLIVRGFEPSDYEYIESNNIGVFPKGLCKESASKETGKEEPRPSGGYNDKYKNQGNFKLLPGDCLVNVNRGKDPWSVIRRWAVGSYSHCFLYMGVLRLGATRYRACAGRVPMIFESYGRGASLRMLSEHYSEEVVVMRLKPQYRRRIPKVLREAIKLASDPQAYYDYLVVVTHLIPWLILQKLGIPVPLKYHRNSLMICSEAIAEVFWRANVSVLPDDIVPLPGDFVTSDLLTKVYEGVLDEEGV